MIKAIFFDLDGTLLNTKKKISESSIRALNECRKNGVKIFIATARPPLVAKMLNWTDEEIALFHGGVYCNGGSIKINDYYENMYIDDEVVKYCIEQVSEYEGLNIALQLKNEVHAFNNPLADFAYEQWGIDKVESLDICACNIEETVKLLIYYENIVDSVTTLSDELIAKLNIFCDNRAKLYVTDNGRVIQIVNKDINKYAGIEKIRQMLGISKSEIAVFGDDANDIEMLTEYENSIAMGNASNDVKSIAKKVTYDNNNDGIAYALKELLNII